MKWVILSKSYIVTTKMFIFGHPVYCPQPWVNLLIALSMSVRDFLFSLKSDNINIVILFIYKRHTVTFTDVFGFILSTNTYCRLIFQCFWWYKCTLSGLCPDWEDWDPKNAKKNAKEAMDAAEKWLDVPQVWCMTMVFILV